MLPLSPKPWSELTFGCADLGDTRRTKRLVKVAAELSAHTGNSLSSSCEGYTALVTGAYRLIENEAVKPEAIAEAGFQATAKIARQSRLLLALEDTTTPCVSIVVASPEIRNLNRGRSMSNQWPAIQKSSKSPSFRR
ncbi:transposase DNA-binding-containing protein [Endozoicomonas sp. SCSIO W0465]|uniref:IS4/Tn5 family transposase DNA-binding protein n=1 Tax=Endozoicomonas sp. SCSIO W0465 TaxID=2918516 RepID=UPI002074C95A|nr:transposase DNA-binding-containing protein [Endozoicomonas sp. SCSIO W0465]USE33743.1 hypothetical protein MJO57_16265 [Endozoicomonas sp. SCSIO W0465]